MCVCVCVLYGPFLKHSLNLLQYCLCFMFCLFVLKACGILVPDQGSNPYPLHWKAKSLPLTTREVLDILNVNWHRTLCESPGTEKAFHSTAPVLFLSVPSLLFLCLSYPPHPCVPPCVLRFILPHVFSFLASFFSFLPPVSVFSLHLPFALLSYTSLSHIFFI